MVSRSRSCGHLTLMVSRSRSYGQVAGARTYLEGAIREQRAQRKAATDLEAAMQAAPLKIEQGVLGTALEVARAKQVDGQLIERGDAKLKEAEEASAAWQTAKQGLEAAAAYAHEVCLPCLLCLPDTACLSACLACMPACLSPPACLPV